MSSWLPGRLAVLALLLAAACWVMPVAADELDTTNLTFSSSLRYDANVFRTPDSVPAPAGSSQKSDVIQSSVLGLHASKQYSQQRFLLNATETKTSFSNFTYLDNAALDYNGTWHWTLTPHLTGTLSVDQGQAQLPFALNGGGQRNLRTTKTRDFTVDGWISGGWHLTAGTHQTETKTEQSTLSAPSNLSHRYETGVRYDFVSGNSITLSRRTTEAELVNRALDTVNLIDTNYRDIATEVKVAWKVNGISDVGVTVSRQERRNEHFSQRDFSGYGGELRYGWKPTGRLVFNLSARRNVSAFAAFGNTVQNSTYKVDQTLSLASSWQANNKIAVNFTASNTHSDYLGPVFTVTAPAQADDFRTAQLGVSYAFARYVSFSASVQKDRRSSNVDRFNYDDTSASISASLNF